MGELGFTAIFCALIAGGEVEVQHGYSVGYDLHRIRVDCETEDEVIEVGLDKRSSLDSLQQALFAAHLTGKSPAILIIDTDGRIGTYETRIKIAADMVGIRYQSLSADFLKRWRMNSWLRGYPRSQMTDAPDS